VTEPAFDGCGGFGGGVGPGIEEPSALGVDVLVRLTDVRHVIQEEPPDVPLARRSRQTSLVVVPRTLRRTELRECPAAARHGCLPDERCRQQRDRLHRAQPALGRGRDQPVEELEHALRELDVVPGIRSRLGREFGVPADGEDLVDQTTEDVLQSALVDVVGDPVPQGRAVDGSGPLLRARPVPADHPLGVPGGGCASRVAAEPALVHPVTTGTLVGLGDLWGALPYVGDDLLHGARR
jgi:hypothetical protein